MSCYHAINRYQYHCAFAHSTNGEICLTKESLKTFERPVAWKYIVNCLLSSARLLGSKMASVSGLVAVTRWRFFRTDELACVCQWFCRRMKVFTPPSPPISKEMPSALESSMWNHLEL